MNDSVALCIFSLGLIFMVAGAVMEVRSSKLLKEAHEILVRAQNVATDVEDKVAYLKDKLARE